MAKITERGIAYTQFFPLKPWDFKGCGICPLARSLRIYGVHTMKQGQTGQKYIKYSANPLFPNLYKIYHGRVPFVELSKFFNV